MRKLNPSPLILLPSLLIPLAVGHGGCIPKKKADAAGTAGGAAQAGAPAGGNLVKNANFEGGTSLPWTPSFTPPAAGSASIINGWYCLDVQNKGSSPWDAQVRHREMTIQKGHHYSIAFKVKADQKTRLRVKVSQAGPPYSTYTEKTIEIGPEPQQLAWDFTMALPDDPTAEFAFHGGGNMALPTGNFQFCIDDVYLSDPEYTPPAAEQKAAIPNVRVNQVGYFPAWAKYATVVDDSTDPQEWVLVDASGAEVAKGQTIPFGEDKDSGDKVHIVDFSSVKKPGRGYILRVGNSESPPFAIGTDLYSRMKYDALAYYYHNRSGIEIRADLAGKPEWARPAGHVSDKKVACAPGTCNYTLDVSGGWYDAGDHGKYVVNGGISVWTLMNEWERAVEMSPSTVAAFGDGKLKIPERGNRVPDLLDEVRWELEFMLRMQVPDGQEKAGMVHHKMHDENWTALGMRPPTDTNEIRMMRYLRPPSTAATLNLAAVAAQGSRVFEKYDPAFAKKLIEAAEKAWAAAQKFPKELAPASDAKGGGPYDDKDVSDELYWAACELYITTSKADYQEFVMKSPHQGRLPGVAGEGGGVPSPMTWGQVAALGTISIAVVPNGLGAAVIGAARKVIIAKADEYLGLVSSQGYRLPLKATADGTYPWGSNSFVLNNMVIIALAYDFTKKEKYLTGVIDGMNYLLGDNALGQSYVSGYGSKPLVNPHHRFWSHQVNAKFPSAPPGAVSGGPNSGLQDPYVQAAGLKGCKPQKCFVDHIESWSTNEITINWNAPFAWLTAWLDEHAK
jgi:endoglucanase